MGIYCYCQSMVESDKRIDFVTVDGSEGERGAAPVEFVGYDVRVARRDGQRRHGVHKPTRPALERATVRRL